ncbi:hypothetical protein [Parabacteroides sp.]|uniref:hypothetical protein n=1 Tax=Parabacteroides sp. TaxID=1869337 RepID=UPI00257CE9FD|nr:hypothetical protein [Parabacteroides sp.]
MLFFSFSTFQTLNQNIYCSSTLYFVWEHRMSNRDNWYSSGWGSNLDRMWGLPATNTFMIKMNYWFNL